MGNTIWQRQRKAARQAGREAVEGGDDRKPEFEHKGLGASYDEGFRERQQEMAQAKAYQEHPLRAISREANRLVETIAGDEPRHLAELVERLADYLLEREDDGK